jgi:hypothetical protein
LPFGIAPSCFLGRKLSVYGTGENRKVGRGVPVQFETYLGR